MTWSHSPAYTPPGTVEWGWIKGPNGQWRPAPNTPNAPKAKGPPNSPSGRGQKQYISFYGQAFGDPSTFRSFAALCGDQPPTITGGYAQWQEVARPLRRALTVFQGYSPTTMQMQIRIMHWDARGNWVQDNSGGEYVEDRCEWLEWMAGFGYAQGQPPFVYLSTLDEQGNTVPLIPFQYQLSSTRNVPGELRNKYVWPWIVTGLDWDPAPVRNRDAYRVRQDATVTVQLFQGQTESAPSVAHRTSKTLQGKSLAFYSRAGADTPLAIAAATLTAPDRVALANAIVKWPANKHLRLRGIRTPIKHGQKVAVPFNY